MGIVRDMPFEEYLAVEAVSKSLLNDLADCPYTAWAKHINPERPQFKPTPAMAAGTLAHTLILEPRESITRYAVKPGGLDLRTTAGRGWAEANADRVIVTAEQWETAQAQRDAVLANTQAGDWLRVGFAEASVFWVDAATGVYCKARPDWIHVDPEGRRVMLDLKTASDVSPDGFARAIATYGYHRQQAHYTSAPCLPVDLFAFVAVSSSYPFIAVTYMLDDESLQQGRDEVAELLTTYAECKRTGTWPTYGQGVQFIALPKWARRSNEIEVAFV